jgi:hypothetical protein
MADVDAQNLSIEQLKSKLRYQGLLLHFFAWVLILIFWLFS